MGTDEHNYCYFCLLLCPYISILSIISNNNFSGIMLLFISDRRKSDFYEFFVCFQQEKKMKKVLLSGLSTHGYKSLPEIRG